jgi:hypothetical protein
MRSTLVFILFWFISFLSCGQGRTIAGRVIGESDLTPIPEVRIQDRDTVLLVLSDKSGNFEIQLPADKDELLFSFIGMEWRSIKVPSDCNRLEVIMVVDANYDFVSTRKINQKRCEIFKQIPSMHRQAYEKGIFVSKTPCVRYIFHEY